MADKKKLTKKAAAPKKVSKAKARPAAPAPKAKKPAPAAKKPVKAAARPAAPVKVAPVKAVPAKAAVKVVPAKAAVKVAPAKAAIKVAPARIAKGKVSAKVAAPVSAPDVLPHKSWTDAERKRFRAVLVVTRERLTRQVSILKGESLQRTEEIITSEDGTDAFDRQFALSVASNEQNAVYEIDEAIRRLDTGRYGICEDCGCEIEKLRLKALPFVRLCVKCQSAQEKNRPLFRVWSEG